MRFILYLLLTALLGYSLEVQVNFGKENNDDFSVLNLQHTSAFPCQEEINVYNEVSLIRCTLNQTPINNFVPTNTAFFEFSTEVDQKHFVLVIRPKQKAKLFATFLDLKKNQAIPKERPKKSKQWQIVGYISQIPFLSNKQTGGLNFPIKIPSTNNLYIGQLDLNLKPLRYEEGVDFKRLKEIRQLFLKQKYQEVFKESNKALKVFPTSIFRKDFLYYKIKSSSYFATKDANDTTISSSLEWIKEYPSDKAIPDVLYILANAYATNHLDEEAYYYYKRIINDYPQTDWVALSKMQIAKNFSEQKLFNATPLLFAEAYQDAKTQRVADEIAIEWGLFDIQDNKKKTQELIELVFKKDPNYFLLEKQKTYSLLKILANHSLYGLASTIGEFLIKNSNKNDDYQEKLTNLVGEWYEEDNQIQKAYQANLLFLKTYPNSKDYQKVVARNDNLFFKMGNHGSPEEKLKALDTIIAKYPNSKESKNAYLLKAQVLFELKRFSEILQIQDQIPNSPLIADSKTEIILRLLQEKQCKQITHYFKGSNTEIIPNEEKQKLFDCLYSISYYKEAKSLIQRINLDDKTAQDELPWLYRLSKVLNKLGDFASSRLSGTDTLNLARTLKKQEFFDIGFILFDDAIKLKLYTQAQEISSFLQEYFSKDPRMLSIWYELLKIAQKDNEDNKIQIYAKEILKLQDLTQRNDFTPYADFALINSLFKTKQFEMAQEYLALLLKKKITQEERQKALYMQGSLLRSMGKDGKESFQECLKIDNKTSWRDLCSKSLELLKKD